jgi:hypothetical protein
MNNGQAVWSGDVFERYHIRYKDIELDLAKAEITRLFYEFKGTFTQLRLLLPNMQYVK